jgi:hypothetical protein
MAQGNIEFDPFSDTFFDDPSTTSMRRRDDAPVTFDEKYRFSALSRHATSWRHTAIRSGSSVRTA